LGGVADKTLGGEGWTSKKEFADGKKLDGRSIVNRGGKGVWGVQNQKAWKD